MTTGFMLQNDHNPTLPMRPPATPAPVLAPPIWRVMPPWEGGLPIRPGGEMTAGRAWTTDIEAAPTIRETLPSAALQTMAASFPAAVADWVCADAQGGMVALVDGYPRPERNPQTHELEADPGRALLASYASRGLSALRHAEGAWSLVLWEEQSQQWLLAVDRLGRCPLEFRLHAGLLMVRGGRSLAAPASAAGEPGKGTGPADDGEDWTRIEPGTHLRVSAAGVSAPAFHGTWRLERRDRRGWGMILGECQARMNSVLHGLEDFPAHVLLADDLLGGALLLQGMQQQGRPPEAVVWLEGWSGQGGLADRTAFSRLCTHFQLPLLEGFGALEQLPPSQQPFAMVSGRGLEVLLPPRPDGLLQRCLHWQPWQADAPARPALHGANLVKAFSARWQPQLAAAAAGMLRDAQAGQPVWPMLDETVAHYLANLPEALRAGTPWRPAFRTAMAQALLPPALCAWIR